ncbi:hypothetical protein WDJ50_10105 [Deinococcus sp. VB142]|uniref:Uncharacterized protein n=1 Tax=Deinococcus sp. VB142 TaxID=3112952 RepID=A0AAU6PZE5_9DEIO
MTAPIRIEALLYPLNFTWTEKALAKSGAALLGQGDYDAIEKRVYASLQKCHGCGYNEKAKTLIVVRDRRNGEVFEIGRECMKDLYGIEIGTFDDHAQKVARTRRELAQKLGLSGDLSTEKQVSIVREAVATYVPVPQQYLDELDRLEWWTLDQHDEQRIRDLHQLACYHRDWQETPEWAVRRWKALRGHPAFEYTSKKDEVMRRCDRALEAEGLLSEQEVHRLNQHLRDAASFKSRYARLVSPEDFDTKEAYEQALEEKIREQAQVGRPTDENLTNNRRASNFNPCDLVGLNTRALFATVGVWDDEGEEFRNRIWDVEAYRRKVRRPIVVVGPPDLRQFPPVRDQRFNRESQEWEDFEREPGWTFRFRRVAWGLVEPFTETYPLWRRFGRSRLERYP